MRLPEVKFVEKSDAEVNMTLFVSDSIEYFSGHFNDFQLLPGVVQVHWAIQYGIEVFGEVGQFSGMGAVKFSRPILPNTLVKLRIQKNSEKNYFGYEYFSDKYKYSSGRVYFK